MIQSLTKLRQPSHSLILQQWINCYRGASPSIINLKAQLHWIRKTHLSKNIKIRLIHMCCFIDSILFNFLLVSMFNV